jgi:hypothetical protein
MVKQKNKQKLYLNPKQREFLAARQKTKTMMAGRGFGKSTVAGVSARQKVSALPRGKNLLCFYYLQSNSYQDTSCSRKHVGTDGIQRAPF